MLLYLGQRLIETCGWLFAPFSWIYAFGVFCRNKLYDLRILPIHKVHSVVVSVGNVVAGGSGKTPFVHLLAKTFQHRKVAILSRGYGKIPDEAMLLAQRLPNVKVYVGKDRVALALQADADLLILDDGFQHRRLHRDFDVVLGETKGHYLPWGFLRDSPKRVKRADFIFGETKLIVKRILDLKGKEIPTIRGWKVAIFCGIAKPHKFKKTVQDLGAEVVAEKYFGDHEMTNLNRLPKAEAYICTEKDAVKLLPTDLPIYYLEMEMEAPEGWQKLVETIDRKISEAP